MSAPHTSFRASSDDAVGPTRLRRICLTAAEAYPALESEFLSARRCIRASFRIFDPETALYSEDARKIGANWMDLLRHVVDRGVDISLTLADFDAIARPELHRLTRRSTRQLTELARDLPAASGTLTVEPAPHPARMGLLPRLALLPVIRKHLAAHCDDLNALPREEQDRMLADMPGLAKNLIRTKSGALRPKRIVLPDVLPATHHQKIAVFDGKSLYIGGLDLNQRRFDTLGHDRPADETWHDIQLLLDGAVAAEAEQHLLRFNAEARGDLPPFQPRELLRTLSASRRLPLPFVGPRTIADELRQAHLDHLSTARDLIYIETQFLRDLPLARALARRGQEEPDLNLVVILPAAPEEIAFSGENGVEMRHGEGLQIRCLDTLRAAFGDRFFAGAPAQRRAASGEDPDARHVLFGAPIIYVHAKLAVFDTHAAIVSSANLNGRSLSWDTEAGVALTHESDIVNLRDRCIAHWVGDATYAKLPALCHSARAWHDLAQGNAGRPPSERQGFLLPFPWSKSRNHATQVPGFPDEVV